MDSKSRHEVQTQGSRNYHCSSQIRDGILAFKEEHREGRSSPVEGGKAGDDGRRRVP